MLLGEYHHNIDEKGRLVIPTKIRNELGNSFYITRGIENCLNLYSVVKWDELVAKLNTLPFTKKDARAFTRFFYSGATVAEFDKSGRINIASPLVSYADIKKECVIIGVGDHVEIWSNENFNKYIDSEFMAISKIAENLFEGD